MASLVALTNQHHRQVEMIAARVAQQVATEARQATVGDIDAWWSRRGGIVGRLVGTAFDLTARFAVSYLGEAAAAVGFDLEPVAAVLAARQLETALRVVGPVGFKTALARTGSPDAARFIMGRRLAGTSRRLTLQGSRDTMFATAAAAPDVVIGYRREAESGACKFCEMLAGRGAVYLSRESAGQVVGRGKTPRARGTQDLGRKFHDNCHCRVHPVWGQPDPRRKVAQPPQPPPPTGPPSLPEQPAGLPALLQAFGLG